MKPVLKFLLLFCLLGICVVLFLIYRHMAGASPQSSVPIHQDVRILKLLYAEMEKEEIRLNELQRRQPLLTHEQHQSLLAEKEELLRLLKSEIAALKKKISYNAPPISTASQVSSPAPPPDAEKPAPLNGQLERSLQPLLTSLAVVIGVLLGMIFLLLYYLRFKKPRTLKIAAVAPNNGVLQGPAAASSSTADSTKKVLSGLGRAIEEFKKISPDLNLQSQADLSLQPSDVDRLRPKAGQNILPEPASAGATPSTPAAERPEFIGQRTASAPLPGAAPDILAPLKQELATLAARPMPTGQASPQAAAPTSQPGAAAPFGLCTERPVPRDQIIPMVYQLNSQGISDLEISQRLHLDLNRVRLILKFKT